MDLIKVTIELVKLAQKEKACTLTASESKRLAMARQTVLNAPLFNTIKDTK